MNPRDFKQLQNAAKLLGEIKSQLIEPLPHFGHEGLFFQNDEITTGQLNNKLEIKIHLLTGQLLIFDNEKGTSIDITKENIAEQIKPFLKTHDLKNTQSSVEPVSHAELSKFYDYAIKAKRTIEMFRMRLDGNFTLVHLWPHHFDFSIEWFTGKKDEQIGTGISPGDDQYSEPYLYMNPYPFNPKITEMTLPIGIWHTASWKGIKVNREDLGNYTQHETTDLLYQLFLIAKKNFEIN